MKTYFEIPVFAIAFCVMSLFAQVLGAQHPLLGTTDINAFIQEAPGLPNTLDEAVKRAYGANPLQPDRQAMDHFYKPFEDKVNRRIKEYQDYARQKMQQHEDNATIAAYEAQVAKDVNRNPVIANMGGCEKINKMSEAEAKAAALQAAAQYTADPFAANGVQSAGMTALYQKVVSDPAYAKKFEKMSEAEKEAELRKYMANDQPVVKTPAQMEQERRQFEQQQQEAELVRNVQEIQFKLMELQEKLGEIGFDFGQKVQEIEQSTGNHQVIDQYFNEKYDQIPLVVLGEMRDKDPDIEIPLRIETARKHRERALHELEQYAVALNEMAKSYQPIVSEYLAFIGENSSKIYGGVSVKDMLDGTNTELPLLSFEAGLIGLALDISTQSRALLSQTAYWEQHYLQVMEGSKDVKY